MKFFTFCVLWYLLVSENLVLTSIVMRQTVELFSMNISKTDETNAVGCVCPGKDRMWKKIERITASEILTGYPNCAESKGDICKFLRECKNCIVNSQICHPPNNSSDFNCVRGSHFLKNNMFGGKYIDAPYGHSRISNRIKRQYTTCAFPEKLKTADVRCNTGGSKVYCVEECIMGYTLKQGTKVKTTCDRVRNAWEPEIFSECEPYIDCSVSMMSGGLSDCYSPTTKSPAMCYIECQSYEDQVGFSKKSYRCGKDGKWTPELPFCAKAGSNLALVTPPRGF